MSDDDEFIKDLKDILNNLKNISNDMFILCNYNIMNEHNSPRKTIIADSPSSPKSTRTEYITDCITDSITTDKSPRFLTPNENSETSFRQLSTSFTPIDKIPEGDLSSKSTLWTIETRPDWSCWSNQFNGWDSTPIRSEEFTKELAFNTLRSYVQPIYGTSGASYNYVHSTEFLPNQNIFNSRGYSTPNICHNACLNCIARKYYYKFINRFIY